MNQQIASFSIKLLGIITLIYSIPFIRPVTDSFFQRKMDIFQNEGMNSELFWYSFVSSSLILIALLLIGTALISYSHVIASRLTNSEETENQLAEISIQSIGFSVIGVYLFASALPQIIEPLSYYYFLGKAGDARPAISVNFSLWASMIAHIVQALIGAALFLGSKGLSSVWYFFQKARPMSKENKNT